MNKYNMFAIFAIGNTTFVCVGTDNVDSWEEINPDTTTWLNDDVGARLFPTRDAALSFIRANNLEDCQPKKVADFISQNS